MKHEQREEDVLATLLDGHASQAKRAVEGQLRCLLARALDEDDVSGADNAALTNKLAATLTLDEAFDLLDEFASSGVGVLERSIGRCLSGVEGAAVSTSTGGLDDEAARPARQVSDGAAVESTGGGPTEMRRRVERLPEAYLQSITGFVIDEYCHRIYTVIGSLWTHITATYADESRPHSSLRSSGHLDLEAPSRRITATLAARRPSPHIILHFLRRVSGLQVALERGGVADEVMDDIVEALAHAYGIRVGLNAQDLLLNIMRNELWLGRHPDTSSLYSSSLSFGPGNEWSRSSAVPSLLDERWMEVPDERLDRGGGHARHLQEGSLGRIRTFRSEPEIVPARSKPEERRGDAAVGPRLGEERLPSLLRDERAGWAHTSAPVDIFRVILEQLDIARQLLVPALTQKVVEVTRVLLTGYVTLMETAFLQADPPCVGPRCFDQSSGSTVLSSLFRMDIVSSEALCAQINNVALFVQSCHETIDILSSLVHQHIKACGELRKATWANGGGRRCLEHLQRPLGPPLPQPDQDASSQPFDWRRPRLEDCWECLPLSRSMGSRHRSRRVVGRPPCFRLDEEISRFASLGERLGGVLVQRIVGPVLVDVGRRRSVLDVNLPSLQQVHLTPIFTAVGADLRKSSLTKVAEEILRLIVAAYTHKLLYGKNPSRAMSPRLQDKLTDRLILDEKHLYSFFGAFLSPGSLEGHLVPFHDLKQLLCGNAQLLLLCLPDFRRKYGPHFDVGVVRRILKLRLDLGRRVRNEIIKECMAHFSDIAASEDMAHRISMGMVPKGNAPRRVHDALSPTLTTRHHTGDLRRALTARRENEQGTEKLHQDVSSECPAPGQVPSLMLSPPTGREERSRAMSASSLPAACPAQGRAGPASRPLRRSASDTRLLLLDADATHHRNCVARCKPSLRRDTAAWSSSEAVDPPGDGGSGRNIVSSLHDGLSRLSLPAMPSFSLTSAFLRRDTDADDAGLQLDGIPTRISNLWTNLMWWKREDGGPTTGPGAAGNKRRHSGESSGRRLSGEPRADETSDEDEGAVSASDYEPSCRGNDKRIRRRHEHHHRHHGAGGRESSPSSLASNSSCRYSTGEPGWPGPPSICITAAQADRHEPRSAHAEPSLEHRESDDSEASAPSRCHFNGPGHHHYLQQPLRDTAANARHLMDASVVSAVSSSAQSVLQQCGDVCQTVKTSIAASSVATEDAGTKSPCFRHHRGAQVTSPPLRGYAWKRGLHPAGIVADGYDEETAQDAAKCLDPSALAALQMMSRGGELAGDVRAWQSGWNRRWVSVHSGQIFFYRHEDDMLSEGRLLLLAVESVALIDSELLDPWDWGWTLRLVLLCGAPVASRQTMVDLKFLCRQERDGWAVALRALTEQAKKRFLKKLQHDHRRYRRETAIPTTAPGSPTKPHVQQQHHDSQQQADPSPASAASASVSLQGLESPTSQDVSSRQRPLLVIIDPLLYTPLSPLSDPLGIRTRLIRQRLHETDVSLGPTAIAPDHRPAVVHAVAVTSVPRRPSCVVRLLAASFLTFWGP